MFETESHKTTKYEQFLIVLAQMEIFKPRMDNRSFLYNNFTPLDSFEVVIDNIFLFNNYTISLLISFFIIVWFFIVFFQNDLSINKNIFFIFIFKNAITFFMSLFKSLIVTIRFQRFIFIILATILFILFTNIAGFFLLELSLTSHAIVTLFLSFSLFFSFFICELLVKFEKIYEKFYLKNLNIFLTIILFFVEVISYFVRPFSLGIRLFANILSGHILIHIFFGALLAVYKLFFWLAILLLFVVIFILIMEIFVSFIQSYIFFILSLIYLSESN